MSKPAVQNVTAAVSQRMRGSSEPRTAIHAAAGAIPRLKPEHQVGERGEALGERIEENDRQRQRAPGAGRADSAPRPPGRRQPRRRRRSPRRSRG